MTRGEIRTALRRQLRDKDGVEWTDTELDATINVAYALVQKEIRKIAPEAHLSWDTMNQVLGQSWYNLPETFSISMVQLRNTSSLEYYPIHKKRYEDIGPVLHTSGAVQVVDPANVADSFYTIRGQFLGVFPTPTVTVVDGIRVLHCPIMQLGADNEVPKIKVPTHIAIVWWAKLITLGDTDENSGETRQRLQEVLGDLGSWYDLHNDTPEQFIPDTV